MNMLRVHTELVYEIELPTSFALSITAARTKHQSVSVERIDIRPHADSELVPYGSGSHQLLRFDAAEGTLEVAYEARVALH
ncbi:MAG: hypothetical protein KJO17_05635, partial [Acidimicrobiia bacterium]|nr:hypothetical protein [Acidimicrobiia bacterium]